MHARRLALAWALGLVLAACHFDTSGIGGNPGDPDADPNAPDADPNAPDANSNCMAVCSGANELSTCDGNGVLVPQACALGCGDTGGPHCLVMTPSNGVMLSDLVDANMDLQIASGDRVVFDTTDGTIQLCGGAVIHTGADGVEGGIRFSRLNPAGNLALGVWALRKIDIQAGGTLTIVGDRGAVILVGDRFRVGGTLFFGGGDRSCSIAAACAANVGTRVCGGPGGGDGGAHDQAGTGDGGGSAGVSGDATVNEIGGGGGGFGGAGGDSGGGGEAVSGGPVNGLTTLTPLVGGSAGGGGGQSDASNAGEGGGGGGALQIVSLGTVEVIADGRINASGAGGGAGNGINFDGGGGGGSGGALLIEAAVVKVAGFVVANGGGGGGGGSTLTGAGDPGSATSGTVAAGGGNGVTGNVGGNGGAGATVAGGDGSPTFTVDGTGGGGGGVGRIFLRAPTGGIDLAGSLVSPTAGQGALVAQ